MRGRIRRSRGLRQRSCDMIRPQCEQDHVGGYYHVMKNRDMACLYTLSLVNWLMYAASVGLNDKNVLAGSKCHGDEGASKEELELVESPSFRLYGAPRDGRTAA
jgi:hypothetical protein